MSHLLNNPFVMAIIGIIFCLLAFFILRRKKQVLVGLVVEKDMSTHNNSDSHVTIENVVGEKIDLVFETYARIGCTHHGGECFHGRGAELDDMIKIGSVLTVEVDRNSEGSKYVYRRLTIRGKG